MSETIKSPNSALYALPRLASSMLMGFADFSLLFLYGVAYNLAGLYVGLALALGKVSIAILQFFFGWVSDHFPFTAKLGRRKPFILFLSPFLALSFVFLVMPGLFLGATSSQLQLFGWFTVTNVAFQGLYGILSPYQAWLAELFPTDKRPRVSAVQNVFMIVGTAVMVVFSMLVLTSAQEQLSTNAANIPPIFFLSVILFSTMMVAFFYITAFSMPVEMKREIKTTLLKDFKNLLKDYNFIHFAILVGLAQFAWAIAQQYLLPLTEVVLGIDFMGYVILSLVMVIVLIISIYFCRKSIDRFGKARTLNWVFLFSAIVLPISLIPMIPLPSPLIFGLIFIPLIAIGLGGWQIFPFIIYADMAENDAKKGSGVLKAGLYAGFPYLPLNIFQAIGLFIAGLLLELPNYAFQIGQESLGYVMWGPLCAIILLVTYFYAKKFIKLDFELEEKETLV